MAYSKFPTLAGMETAVLEYPGVASSLKKGHVLELSFNKKDV